MTLTRFPAVHIISRPPTQLTPSPLVVIDSCVVHNETEAERRSYELIGAADTLPARTLYRYMLTPLDTAPAVANQIRAELEPASPTSPSPDEPEPAVAEEIHAETKARLDLVEDYPPRPAPLQQAIDLAHAAFAGNPASLRRLERAVEIVDTGKLTDLGGSEFEVLGASGTAYRVNGTCTCPDFLLAGTVWCKHRLARALVLKARQIENGAGSAVNTPAPKAEPPSPEIPTGSHGTLIPAPGQVDLVLAFDDGPGAGRLVYVLADGLRADRPAADVPAIDRWLQANGYRPAACRWENSPRLPRRLCRRTYLRATA